MGYTSAPLVLLRMVQKLQAELVSNFRLLWRVPGVTQNQASAASVRADATVIN